MNPFLQLAASVATNPIGSTYNGFLRYTTLTAFTGLGPAEVLLLVQSGAAAYLPAHLNLLSTYSASLRDAIASTAKAFDPASGLQVVPLQGDCTVDWLQALTAMYMHTEGANDADQWVAMLVSLPLVASMQRCYHLKVLPTLSDF